MSLLKHQRKDWGNRRNNRQLDRGVDLDERTQISERGREGAWRHQHRAPWCLGGAAMATT
jgi:hypothetical protein